MWIKHTNCRNFWEVGGANCQKARSESYLWNCFSLTFLCSQTNKLLSFSAHSSIMSTEPDDLFTMRTLFWLGNYQVLIFVNFCFFGVVLTKPNIFSPGCNQWRKWTPQIKCISSFRKRGIYIQILLGSWSTSNYFDWN